MYIIGREYQNFIFVLSYIISLCGILHKYKQLLFNKIILILRHRYAITNLKHIITYIIKKNK